MKWLTITLLLTSCYLPPVDRHMQIMPFHDVGVRAGCVRALARFTVDYRLFNVLTMDEIYRRCDEVERSFYEELKAKEWQQT